MEIRNPAKLPTNLNPAEQEFAHCLAEGIPCIVGNGDFSTPRPEGKIEAGKNANVVRSEVIRFFAYGGNEKNSVLGPLIYLRGAWISGGLDLTHASIPYVLRFDNCHFDDYVMMQHMECAALYLNGSHLAQGLLADGLTAKGAVFLCGGFSIEGGVRLLNANIGGDLDCAGGKFKNSDGYVLFADNMTVKGNVHLRRNFSAEGEVRMLNANIGGDLSCEDGSFHNSGGHAFFADKMTVKGDVHLRRNFSAKGGVRLVGASIGGHLDCEGGKFHNSGGHALSADGLATTSSVHLRRNFSAEGEVRLLNANIGKDLDCVGGQFHNLDGEALNIAKAKISGGLLWWDIICEGNVNLAYARADVLADDSNSWKSCKVVLEGFTYNRLLNHENIDPRLRWLSNRPDRINFSLLPYEQAAKVLFEMGRTSDAREILLEKERLQTKCGQMRRLRRVGRRLWDVFAGYGYRLRYTAAWMLGIVAIGTVIFGAADWHSNIIPTHPVVALSDDYKMEIASNGMRPTQAVPSEYPAFNPLVFSLDVFTPSAVFHQEDSWGPRSGGGDWKDFDVDILWFLTLWYWFEVAMGWILTSMLLLSVTGLLRPRQSSSERD